VEGGAVEEGRGEFFFAGRVGELDCREEKLRWRREEGRYPRVMRADASEEVMKEEMYIRSGEVEIISVV